MNQFPAIAIGGPPHAGKSVLNYSLTQALRQKQIEHYVIRACPDGEGDWSNETPPRMVTLLRKRNKGKFTEHFVEQVCEALAGRHLPLLVDVGGRPTPEQEVLFDHCTHAILLVKEDADLERWRELAQKHGLIVIAELYSSLEGEDEVWDERPFLQAKITGLERQDQAEGPTFDALLQRVKAFFAYDERELRQAHLTHAPTELSLEIDRPIATVKEAAGYWVPNELPKLLASLPTDEPLSIYGRGPVWLYAAIALHIAPTQSYQFDPRLGWITPPTLQVGRESEEALLDISPQISEKQILLDVKINSNYLDYDEAESIRVPPILANRGLILSGQLPIWLFTALSRCYQQHVPWIAIYQPALGQAIVVYTSPNVDRAVGDLVILADGLATDNRS